MAPTTSNESKTLEGVAVAAGAVGRPGQDGPHPTTGGGDVARFIIDVLADRGLNVQVPMSDLVGHAAARDKALTPVIFFKPEAVPEITDEQGRIVWDRVQPGHYRSTTFFQYKSVLKHAGVLAPHALGGASAHQYRPGEDVWELR